MSNSIKFGAIYFHHPEEKEYVGPKLIKELGATFMQIDTAYVGLWYQIQKGPDFYDWSLLDTAYDKCKDEGIEPMPSFCHHFMPPDWVGKGPFNDVRVDTPQYAKEYGPKYAKLTVLQKAFADFVTELVKRYRGRTNVYTFGHEQNVSWIMACGKGTPEYEKFIENELMCTLLAHNIVKKLDPKARISYGLLSFYRRDALDGKRITPLTYGIDDPHGLVEFGPSFMIKKYVETGNKDFLDLLNTSYMFHLGYTTAPEGLAPLYSDDTAGDTIEAWYNGKTTVGGETYNYKDYIKNFIAVSACFSGIWNMNKDRPYSEKEHADLIGKGINGLLEASSRGVPIDRIMVSLNDKNEYFTSHAYDPWLFVPEGIYKMRGQPKDPLKRGPTTWSIVWEPKEAVKTYKKIISKYS